MVTMFLDLIWLIPLAPLAGAIANGIFGRRFSRPLIVAIACGAVLAAFVLSVGAFAGMVSLPEEQLPVARSYFTWIESGPFVANAGFLLDPLSGMMILIVTGVGLLIHIYSAGYMAHEDGLYRYFAYLNLFMFSMLTLVLADNYLLMFVGWEGVGLCSYLLIGFYFQRRSATDAGKKAFVVNRVGDFGFILATALIFWTFGSVDYLAVFAQASERSVEPMGAIGAVTAACLLMLLGATGKSAQIPLYVWLPDAMEGPTPVSALIHAATMVTAGVYMIARSAALFDLAPTAGFAVAAIGAVTALFAATIGLVQNDIKRVLAYSTVSQLGYMFLGVGVGAYAAGVFHLMTHAFFKALLFLGAGSVIHGMGGIQDLRKMGGLRHEMPWTFRTFLIGGLALAGFPGLAGFFSKDAVLWGAFSYPAFGPLLWGIGVLAAGLTAFYTFRLIILAFFGAPRYTPGDADHVHESPASMTIPLVLLAAFSVVAGYAGVPAVLGGGNHFEHFLEPVVGSGVAEGDHTIELLVMGTSVAAGLVGIFLAWMFYARRPGTADAFADAVPGVHRVLANRYYVDEAYDAAVVRPILETARQYLWRLVDAGIIDGFVNGTGRAIASLGSVLRRMQAGNVRAYAGWILTGSILILLGLVFG